MGLGDWLGINKPNVNFTSNVFYQYNLKLFSQISSILGFQETSEEAYIDAETLIKNILSFSFLFLLFLFLTLTIIIIQLLFILFFYIK